jgi:hypothetical protein
MAKKDKKNNTITRGFRSESGFTMHIRTSFTGSLTKYDPRIKARAVFKQIKNK